MARPIAIGGGAHARSLLSMAPSECRPTSYVSPTPSLPLDWLGDDAQFLADDGHRDDPVIITFVSHRDCSMTTRRKIIEKYATRDFATIISQDALIAPDTLIGNGTMIFPRTFVNTGAAIGNHCIINTGAIIEHDVSIGDNTFVGPGAIICGGVNIGADVFVGAGACIKNGISITDGCVIGAGAVVVKDISKTGVYVGNPAKLKCEK
ncbi:MAG: NeuD/PglB/VioB family sugar acetyltransferase [Muribaculaceae bacterium]|nr:NeuD/PglB/VioB family sugar acetyltransferase [Muribaculaceae bacterium]